MIIHKGFKFRLKPTRKQKQMLLQHAGNTRFLWNNLLSNNIEYYKKEKKFNFHYVMSASLPGLKEEYDFLKLSFSQSLQTVGRQLNDALVKFLKERKTNKNIGFPRFKQKNLEKDSFHCPQTWKFNKGFVRIPKIGNVKWIKHRNLQGKPKSITITQDGNHWYCSVLCEVEIKEQEKNDKNIIGIDVGLKKFAVFSNKKVIKKQNFTKLYKKKLSKEQRKLSKKKKGSSNRKKQKRKVQKINRLIRNSRRDFLHKTTSCMIAKYDGFCVENLSIQNMLKENKKDKNSVAENRSTIDASWYEFIRLLEYKSIWNFKHFIKIDKWFPSTKTCFKCKSIKDMPRSIRVYKCACGFKVDRDYNASLNIREEGLNTLGRREINACGDGKVHEEAIAFQSPFQVTVCETGKRNYG